MPIVRPALMPLLRRAGRGADEVCHCVRTRMVPDDELVSHDWCYLTEQSYDHGNSNYGGVVAADHIAELERNTCASSGGKYGDWTAMVPWTGCAA